MSLTLKIMFCADYCSMLGATINTANHCKTPRNTHKNTQTHAHNTTINYDVRWLFNQIVEYSTTTFNNRDFQRLLLTSYTAWIFNLTTSICMIFIDLSHRRHRFSYPNFRRRKVCLDFGLKSSWACLCRGVYQQVDQRCAWVVTVKKVQIQALIRIPCLGWI